MPRIAAFAPALLALGLLGSAGSHAASINAAQIATAGNGRGAPSCSSCHGQAGEGNPAAGFPRLAGLPADYLTRQMAAFASGQRQNPMMVPVAKALSTDEARALGVYYAHLPEPAPANGVGAPRTSGGAAAILGRTLADRGRWSEDVPACVQCHGAGGSGVGANFPPLAGQSVVYLVNQLQAWQKGTRDPGPLGLMGGIAKKLSDADVHAVADYFSLQPVRPTEATP